MHFGSGQIGLDLLVLLLTQKCKQHQNV